MSFLPIIYVVSALTAMICAALLLRGYWRGGGRLLLWSGLCFLGLALDNILLLCDLYYPDISLDVPRKLASVVGLSALIYGMIWDVK
jgi:hypothetical protein